MRRLLLVLCATVGCSDSSGPASDATATPDAPLAADAAPPDATPEPPLVQQGIALCYQSLHGDTAVRQQALDTLKQATTTYPDHGRAFLFLGMCSLAALAEDGNVGVFADIQPALERAYELDPTDARIPGWIGTVAVRSAQLLGTPAELTAAIDYMIAAADAYPEFNNVSLAIAFSPLPLDGPYPQMAVDRLQAIVGCGATDPRCLNNPNAPHNVPGSLMLFGDVYARIGDRATALSYYQEALAADGADTWPYRDIAQSAVDDVDARLAEFQSANPPYFATGMVSCRGCHE